MAGELAPLSRRSGFFLGSFLRHPICLTQDRATVPNGARWDRRSQRTAPCTATMKPPKPTAIGAPANSAIAPAIMPPTGISSHARP